jgi:hypothetical protein
MLTAYQAIFAKEISKGTLSQLWAGTTPEGKDLNGEVSIDHRR